MPKKKTDGEVIQTEFQKRFGEYEQLFETADHKVAMMKDDQRLGYYVRARDLAENDVLKFEIAEMKRSMYSRLALTSKTDLEREGLRLSLIAIAEFQKRIATLGRMYAQKPLQSLSSKL